MQGYFNKSTKNYEFKLSNYLPEQFIKLSNDILKFTFIIIIYNFMLYARDSKLTDMSSTLEETIYVVLGLSFYWIVFDKLFKIT